MELRFFEIYRKPDYLWLLAEGALNSVLLTAGAGLIGFIFLFLTTGVISEIGVRDLTQAGLFIDSRTFRSFEVFITLTVIYIVLALGFKTTLSLLQKKLFPWQGAR